MRIIVPPITRPVYLTAYVAELVNEDKTPITVYVWVNPPHEMRNQLTNLLAQTRELRARLEKAKAGEKDDLGAIGQEMVEVSNGVFSFYAAIWSKHSNAATHWSFDDVRALAGNDTDPGLFDWLTTRTWETINAYQSGEKKV